jgi:tetratricopeptide (TPR) repeat protein
LLILAYLPALRSGFIWDDDFYVTENQALRSMSGLRRIWLDPAATPQYYPLVHTSFWVEYHVWGLKPLGFHAVNLGLHALAALLLYLVLRRLEVLGAWLAAAIFALHPVEVESVAWIAERKNVLSAVFYLAAASAYLRFAPAEEQVEEDVRDRSPDKRLWGSYLVASFFFIAALLSKSVTCSLPAALLLVRWWKAGRLLRSDVWPLVPWFVIGAASGFLTSWLERHQVGAHGADWSLTGVERMLIAGRALWFYAGNLAWPFGLCFSYPRWHIDAGQWWQWIYPAAAVAMVGGLWMGRRRIGRGPLVGVFFFAGTVGPALGFIDIFPMRYTFVADHYQYLAGIGLIVLAGFCLHRPPRVLVAGLLVALAGLTWRQAHIYRDVETLWLDTQIKNPESSLVHNYFGNKLLTKGDYAGALELFRRDLAINPNDEVAHFNVGYALLGMGKPNEAIHSFEEAARLRPRYSRALYYLGNALVKEGRVDEAIEAYHRALTGSPTNSAILNSLGGALMRKGQYAEAAKYFQAAIQSNPEIAALHSNLGQALASLNQLDAAAAAYETSLKLNPNSAVTHTSLGLILLKKGSNQEGRVHLEEAVRLNRLDPSLREPLGTTLPEPVPPPE